MASWKQSSNMRGSGKLGSVKNFWLCWAEARLTGFQHQHHTLNHDLQGVGCRSGFPEGAG